MVVLTQVKIKLALELPNRLYDQYLNKYQFVIDHIQTEFDQLAVFANVIEQFRLLPDYFLNLHYACGYDPRIVKPTNLFPSPFSRGLAWTGYKIHAIFLIAYISC